MTYEQLKAKLRGSIKSLTIWFNGVVAAAVPALAYLQDQYETIRAAIPANMTTYAVLGLVTVNVLLRFKTKKPLEEK